MTKRQYKKHIKKSVKLGIVSMQLSERYLKRYNIYTIKNMEQVCLQGIYR